MKNIFYLSLLLILCLTACDEPGRDALLPADTAIVELSAATTVTGSKGFLYLRENNGVPKPSGFEVTLTGQQRNSPTNVTFAIDPSSTAIEGVHYTVSSTTATIAANTSTTELPIMILADNIEAGELWTIVVNLVSSDVDVSPLYNSATHEVQIICESDLAGDYDAAADGNFGDGAGGQSPYSGLTAVVTLTDNGNGLYSIDDMSFGLYPQGYGDTPPMGRVQDVCGDLSDVGDSDQYSDPFTIAGTVDGSTGVITLTWSNTWGDNGTVTLTPK